jgi:hypothetical protein
MVRDRRAGQLAARIRLWPPQGGRTVTRAARIHGESPVSVRVTSLRALHPLDGLPQSYTTHTCKVPLHPDILRGRRRRTSNRGTLLTNLGVRQYK